MAANQAPIDPDSTPVSPNAEDIVAATEERKVKIATLQDEYEILVQGMEESFKSVLQLVSLASLGLGAVVGILSRGEPPNLYILWATPALALILYAIAVVIAFRSYSYLFQLRIVSERLSRLTGEPIWVYSHSAKSLPSRFGSMRRGNAKYRMMVFALLAVVAIFVLYLLVWSFAELYAISHLQGTLFAAIYGCFVLCLLLGLHGAYHDLPVAYDRLAKQLQSGQPASLDIQGLVSRDGDLLAILLPRPSDFIRKSWLFVFGAATVLWLQATTYNARIGMLFVGPGATGSSIPPFWTILAFSACWFLIQEGIVQQAKYLWNDVRDREVDRSFAAKRGRAVTRSSMAPGTIAVLSSARWLLGLFLGLLLDPKLFWLLVVISLAQIVYELWAKPHGATRPLIPLVLLAFGSAIRVLGGALSVGGSYVDVRVTLVVTTFLFFGIGTMACFFRTEADYQEKNELMRPRPQADHFRAKEAQWQDFGFAGMLLCSLLSLLIASYCAFSGRCAGAPFVLALRSASLWQKALMLAAEYIAIVGMTALLTRILCRPITATLRYLAASKRRFWGFVVLGVFLMIAALIGGLSRSDRGVIGALVLVALSILAFVTYQDMDYERFMLVYLSKNLGLVARLWFHYIFDSSSGLSFKAVLYWTRRLANEEIDPDALAANTPVGGEEERARRT